MDRLNRSVLLSASDLVQHAACEYLTGLSLAAVRDGRARPEITSPDLLARIARGFDHEAAYLAELEMQGKRIYRVETDRTSNAGLLLNAVQTQVALRAGYDVVYQPTFLQHRNGFAWQGHGDFAIRNAQGVYEIYDTKLARAVKPGVLIQLGLYSEMLGAVQGMTPEHFHVVLGDGAVASYRTAEVLPFVRDFRERFEADIRRADFPVRPEPVAHCGICEWQAACEQQWVDADHLKLVRGMRPEWRGLLEAAGIGTMARLAVVPPYTRVPGIAPAAFAELHAQARLQVRGRETGTLTYELREPMPGRGYATLPAPRTGDLFLDFEANVLERDPGFAYLFVTVDAADPDHPEIRTYWADSERREGTNVRALARRILEARARDPKMHVYHWGNFDQALMRQLMEHHRVPCIDDVLDAFVDMYAIFRDGGRLSDASMSLKVAEKLWAPDVRESDGVDGATSIAMREAYLREPSRSKRRQMRVELETYCREDTLQLLGARRYFLEQVRTLYGRRALPLRAEVAAVGGSEEAAMSDDLPTMLELAADALRAALPSEPARDTEAQHSRRLLADLMDWHRREQKPEWREHFARMQKPTHELIADDRAIGGLSLMHTLRDDDDADRAQIGRYAARGVPYDGRRSVIQRYSYDWTQEHRIFAGDRVIDPRNPERPETLTVLDNDEALGMITVKRSRRHAIDGEYEVPLRNLLPEGPPSVKVLQRALLRVAALGTASGLPAASPFQVADQLLRAASPRRAGGEATDALVQPGEDQAEAVARLVTELDRGVLAVQGPPGSGKTFAAAQAIRRFIGQNPSADGPPRRVGVMASSHKVVSNLLEEVARQAEQAGEQVEIVQLNPGVDRSQHGGVRTVTAPSAMERAWRNNTAQVFGGTAWYFAREENLGAFDLLVVDEAGQISLADTVAAAPAARNLLLVGDPAQLTQPIRGRHPAGTTVSAIGHIIGDHATMPPDRGVFFDSTRRLGANCTFISEQFYEGRLERHSDNPERCIPGLEMAHGLMYLPVEHDPARVHYASSIEEAERIRDLIDALQGYTLDDGSGTVRPITESDVLVVTPFNAQVARLRNVLGGGVPVLTVDKAQGREAPIVIYSLATSDPRRSPRGHDFVFSRNRLNVAVSRAQILSVVVASPRIFEPLVSRPEDILRVGAHLRLIELADARDVDSERRNALGRLDLGARVRIARKRHGFTQRSLATQLGCSAETVGRLERGEVESRLIPSVIATFGWDANAVRRVLSGADRDALAAERLDELVPPGSRQSPALGR